jgi:integrase
MSAKKRSVVRRGNSHLTVFPYGDRWRFGWREKESEPWRYVTRGTKKAAEEAAWEKLGEIDAGGLVWSGLDGETRRFLQDVHRLATPADFEAVKGFLQARRKSSEIVASVERFMDHKVSQKDGETRHLGNVRRDLEAMAKHFAGRVLVDISDAELKAWWESRTTGRSGKTRNEARGNLVAFWNWAVRDGIHPKEVTAAEKLPRVELGICERRVLSSAELLAVAGAVREEWRVWVVLGAFCGLRPEEIAPTGRKIKTRKNKRGLRCEEIDFNWKVIRVPAEVSKVGAPRLVPLSDAALEWLAWAGIKEGDVGAVCARNPSEEDETARVGKLVFSTGWPQDALRHSYGSMRNAVLRNLPQVAEEMGTSETMLRRHYHNPRTSEEGGEWFGLRPEMIRFDPMGAVPRSGSQEIIRAAGA